MVTTADAPRPATEKPARKKPERRLNFFRVNDAYFTLAIADGRTEKLYHVDRERHDLGEEYIAFRFTKFKASVREGEDADHWAAVHLRGNTHMCTCPGHQVHGHRTRCRHLAALLVLLETGKINV